MANDGYVLVERFEDLRPGDMVKVRDCAFCGREETGILGRRVECSIHNARGEQRFGLVFLFHGNACRRDNGRVAAISDRDVDHRLVWRRVDLREAAVARARRAALPSRA